MATVDGRDATAAELGALALTGFGHFTSMHVEDGAVRGLDLHLDRLTRDCKTVFDADLDRVQVLSQIRQTVAAASCDHTLRVTVFDPRITLGNVGAVDAHPVSLFTTRASAPGGLSPLRAKTVEFQRDTPEVKHVGLFSQLHHRVAAKRAEFDDVLFVDPASGRISEGSTWNIGFVAEDGQVIWPEAAVLPGVTMALLTAADTSHVTRPVPSAEVSQMRAAFATNASIGVRPIRTIDKYEFDVDDPVVVFLQEMYREIPAQRP
ncbi:aminotransferase class IV [Nocardioides sp. NPDC006273]|uniref:aminotransferase class IV n=1 Tax=Nocardioides sp. NPDC006273 TaxID=3155598 RepID=UPI0033A914A8